MLVDYRFTYSYDENGNLFFSEKVMNRGGCMWNYEFGNGISSLYSLLSEIVWVLGGVDDTFYRPAPVCGLF